MRNDSTEDKAHFRTMEADIERLTMRPYTFVKGVTEEEERTVLLARDSAEKLERLMAGSHEGRTFETGATRDTDEGKFDYEAFSAPIVERTYASYMHDNREQVDGVIRDGDNWQNGMPRRQYMKSLIRHVFDLWHLWRQPVNYSDDGLVTLLCAIRFNVNGLLYEILLGREVPEDA